MHVTFLIFEAMVSKYLISLFAILFLSAAGCAQTGYSESAEYKPRSVPTATPKKERKKKSTAKDETPAVPAVTVPAPGNADSPTAAGEMTVTVPISVRNRSGAAIAGIPKEEISIWVDGSEVPILAFEQDKEPVTVVLILDSSPSAEKRFKTMQEQASKLVSQLPADMKVMVLDFNERLNVRSEPTTNRNEARAAISKVTIGQGTSIYSTVQFMYTKILPTLPGRKVIVLMTDGVDTTSKVSDFAKSLAEVEKEDITIYPVYFDTFTDRVRNADQVWIDRIIGLNRSRGMGGTHIGGVGATQTEYKTGSHYLNDLAAASGGRVFSSEKLADETKSLLSELENRYYATISVPRKNSGSRRVRVRVNRPSLAVFARGSFVEK